MSYSLQLIEIDISGLLRMYSFFSTLPHQETVSDNMASHCVSISSPALPSLSFYQTLSKVAPCLRRILLLDNSSNYFVPMKSWALPTYSQTHSLWTLPQHLLTSLFQKIWQPSSYQGSELKVSLSIMELSFRFLFPILPVYLCNF